MPGVRANSVSSPPRPTPRPGWMRVPRWRTRMAPPLTSWPPKTFTPSRCAWESRPLREAAAPFLCAMSLLKVPGRSGLVGDWRRLGRRCNPGLRGRPLRAVASSDGRDLDQRVELAVAVADRVAAFVLVLEDDDLVALGVSQHLRSHRVRARLVADESPPGSGRDEDRREAHVVALVGEVLDLQHIPGLDPVLLSSGAYHCVHRSCLPARPRRDRALEKPGHGMIPAAGGQASRSRRMMPRPSQRSHTSEKASSSPSDTFLRVICTRPSSETAYTWVRVLSRARAARNSRTSSSRLRSSSMSMKSMTMIPPMSRSRSCFATSLAASRLVLTTVSSRLD